MNVLIGAVVLQVIAHELAGCQGSGGPSTFGYDASSACSKPFRTGRSRFASLPCDFRRQNWCTVAGSSYPWHAVRRFVQENQGLMRRMYGDQGHLNVLKNELEKDDIELRYDDYPNNFDDPRKYQYIDDYEYMDVDEAPPKLNNEEYEGRGFTSRSLSDSATKRANKFPKLSEYTRPHFRPTERTSTTATASSMASTTTSSTTSTTAPSTAFTIETTTTGTTSPSTTTSPAQERTITPVLSTTSFVNSTSESSNDTTSEQSPTVTTTQTAKDPSFDINEIPGQIDRIDEDVEEEAKTVEASQGTPEGTTTVTSSGTTAPPDDVEIEDDVFDNSAMETTVHDTIVAPGEQKFRPRPEYRPVVKPEASTVENQLYQDVAAKEQHEQPLLKLRGVNACPVKEEVIAPYWANNTRGELLVLLNIYPFEQYVHLEKCTHENKQMYCRDGCRCEQQFRLHRLLAYDPFNECRGVFSDWFRFPSCCICRCYDVPFEFRVTSRSPRTSRQSIRVRPPRSRFS